MINSDISFLGVSLLVVLLMASIVIYWLIDRKEMMRVLKVFGLMAGQMTVIGVIIWTVYKANAWWANLLWLVVLIALATGWCLLKMRKTWKQMLMPIIAALTAGTLIGSGVMMLCLSGRFFIPVTAVVVAHLVVAVKDTLQTYQRSLMHTEAHRQYMQANGASLLESLMPSVHRALRATVQPQVCCWAAYRQPRQFS